MNINKFTQKSLEAVQRTEKLAYEYGNQQIDQEHLLYSLLTIDDSLILKLLTKMGVQENQFLNEVQGAIEKLPKVSGGQVYFSQDANKVLVSAEDEAKSMGDEYVSVKYLQKSDTPDHIVLVSYNEHHKPMEIHINRIRALAFIKASLRLNSLK